MVGIIVSIFDAGGVNFMGL